jgi:hypothetical protein
MAWYVVVEGSEAVGPVEDDLIERGILTSKIPIDAQICAVGEIQWKSMASVPLFAQAMRAVAPPPPSPGRTDPPSRPEQHTLSDIFPLATEAPPYIPRPAPLPTYGHHEAPPPAMSPSPQHHYAHQGPSASTRNAPTNPPQQQYAPQAPNPQNAIIYPPPQAQVARNQPTAQPYPPQSYEQPGPPAHDSHGQLPAPFGVVTIRPAPGPQTPAAAAGYSPYTHDALPTGPPRGQLLAAAILTSIAATFWFLVVLFQILNVVTADKGELGVASVLVIVAVVLDIWIMAALWGRKRAGYTFGLPAHGLNAVLGLYQLFGTTPFLILIVPVHAFAIATIWAARHELPAKSQAPNAASTAKISAQRLADIDTVRVLLGIAGIVAIAVSILFLIFLARQQ